MRTWLIDPLVEQMQHIHLCSNNLQLPLPIGPHGRCRVTNVIKECIHLSLHSLNFELHNFFFKPSIIVFLITIGCNQPSGFQFHVMPQAAKNNYQDSSIHPMSPLKCMVLQDKWEQTTQSACVSTLQPLNNEQLKPISGLCHLHMAKNYQLTAHISPVQISHFSNSNLTFLQSKSHFFSPNLKFLQSKSHTLMHAHIHMTCCIFMLGVYTHLHTTLYVFKKRTNFNILCMTVTVCVDNLQAY